jgi:hypothetical protein
MYPSQPAYVCLKLLGSECKVLERLMGKSKNCRYRQLKDAHFSRQQRG